jgi:hypothetical protein
VPAALSTFATSFAEIGTRLKDFGIKLESALQDLNRIVGAGRLLEVRSWADT